MTNHTLNDFPFFSVSILGCYINIYLILTRFFFKSVFLQGRTNASSGTILFIEGSAVDFFLRNEFLLGTKNTEQTKGIILLSRK